MTLRKKREKFESLSAKKEQSKHVLAALGGYGLHAAVESSLDAKTARPDMR